MPRKHAPVHPGEILWLEFLQPMGIHKRRLALETGMPADRVTRLIKGTRAFTADTALRLARYLGTSPEFWMNLQARYDLDCAIDQQGQTIRQHVRPYRAA